MRLMITNVDFTEFVGHTMDKKKDIMVEVVIKINYFSFIIIIIIILLLFNRKILNKECIMLILKWIGVQIGMMLILLF